MNSSKPIFLKKKKKLIKIIFPCVKIKEPENV